jgi:hypothetical protein
MTLCHELVLTQRVLSFFNSVKQRFLDEPGEGQILGFFDDGSYSVSYAIDGGEPQNENMSEEQLAEF